MSHFYQSLEENLSSTLRRLGFSSSDAVTPQYEFPAFKEATNFVINRFDYGAPPAPPLDQRRTAIRKLLSMEPLSIRDWRLVSYGLTDSVIDGLCLLQKETNFNQVHVHFLAQIDTDVLRRKTWFGLVTSYFSFNDPQRNTNPSWLALRGIIISAFHKLKAAQKSPKKWIDTVNHHSAIFTATPSNHLAQLLFHGQLEELSTLKTILQISENSWLWEQMFLDLADNIAKMSEATFVAKINALLDLMKIYPQHANALLAMILKRYERSSMRDTIHHRLKDASLEIWGSPQIGFKKNVWLLHAGEDVVKMVLRWFAKDDLEHFFKLLQGEAGVDQNRLTYWLRFVDQMAFTRILLGHDAFYDRGTEYAEFRAKNKGRFGQLTGGGASSNNAFIMQIGEYIFVEFSGKGNACYTYQSEKVPFRLDSAILNLNSDLKKLMVLSIPGVVQNKFNHSPNWEPKADQFLYRLGIQPDMHAQSLRQPAKPLELNTSSVKNRTVAQTSTQRPFVSGSGNNMHTRRIDDVIRAARGELRIKSCNLPEEDNRSKDGAFWFLTNARIASVDQKLMSWGFRFTDRGYWIK